MYTTNSDTDIYREIIKLPIKRASTSNKSHYIAVANRSSPSSVPSSSDRNIYKPERNTEVINTFLNPKYRTSLFVSGVFYYINDVKKTARSYIAVYRRVYRRKSRIDLLD